MRYFFHIRHSDFFVVDEEGTEMEGLEEAKSEAQLAAREMIAEAIKTGTPVDLETGIEVEDEGGRDVHELSFATALMSCLAPTAAVPALPSPRVPAPIPST